MTEQDDFAHRLLARWRWILAFSVIGAVAGGVYGFVSPQWFEARLTVVPSERSPQADLLSKLPGIGALTGSSSSADVQRIRAVLTSNSVVDAVIAKFDLQRRYGETYLERTRLALWSHCTTSVDKKSGIVELTCEDKDPVMAKNLAAEFGSVGNEVFKRISASSAREERVYLEGQVAAAKKDVEEVSRQLREFQEKYRMVDLPEQAKAVISAMASIKGDILSKQLELSYLSGFSSPSESSVRQLQQQIAVLENKLRQLEDAPSSQAGSGSAQTAAAQSSFFPEAMQVPELRYQLEELVRDQKIKETIFFLMSQRYESAKADEARDTSTFQILDYPTLPTFRSRPKRLRSIAAGAAFGAALAVAGIAFLMWRQRLRHRA
jgi:uncharacterized protein involved in exopolysaccharide biosynthesis